MSLSRPFRLALADRWWSLSDRQFRVAVTLLDAAEDQAGALVVHVTSEQLAARCGTNRMSLRRALDQLSADGFCTIAARPGNGGATEIVITTIAHTVQSELFNNTNSSSAATYRPYIQESDNRTDESVSSVHSNGDASSGMLCESLADQGGRVHSKPPDPYIRQAISGQNAAISRARDLDLLRSPKEDQRSDLRSSDLEIPTRSVGETETKARRPRKQGPRQDAAKVPERAWKAADYLRSQVLQSNPASVDANRPWEYGYRGAGGTTERIGDGSRSGHRLAWANQFRLFHAKVLRAMRNADPNIDEDAVWKEIARTVKWLFHDQQNSHQFKCFCPDSISGKWDRIQDARKSQAASRNGRTAYATPMSIKYEDKGPPVDNLIRSKR